MSDLKVSHVDRESVTIEHTGGHFFRFGWARYNGAWVLEQRGAEWNRKAMPLDEAAALEAAREMAREVLPRPN